MSDFVPGKPGNTSDKGEIRILHVFGRMNRGGAEMRTLDMMRRIDRSIYRFEFCALSGLPGDLDDDVRELGGQVHRLSLGFLFPGRFGRLIEHGGYQVVHSHVHSFSGFLVWLAARKRVPVRIAHFHNTHDGRSNSPGRRIQRRLMKWLIDRFATDIIAVSRGVLRANWPTVTGDRRYRVIFDGLDVIPFMESRDRDGVRRMLDLSEETPLVVHVGRMDPVKNHERLLRIFHALLRLRPEARLVMIGRGGTPIERRIRALVNSLGIESRVHFLGLRSDVPRILKAADVLVFPSLWEGLPGAVLEACAARIPVVASDLPGILEIAGYFPAIHPVPLSLSDEGWAERVASVLSSPGEKPFIAYLTTPFSMDRILNQLREIWDRGGSGDDAPDGHA